MKKRFFATLLLGLLALFAPACSDSGDHDVPDMLTLANKKDASQTFPATGAREARIEFAASKHWTAESTQKWLTVTPAEGDGGEKCSITLTVGAYDVYTPRRTTLHLRCGEILQRITVTQLAFRDELEVKNPDAERVLTAHGDPIRIDFTSAGKWKVRSETAWLKVEPASGDGGERYVTVTADENPAYDFRSGKITIETGSDLSCAVEIRQQPSDIEPEITLLTPAEGVLRLPAEGSTGQIGFTSAGEWSIEPGGSWLTVSPDKGFGGEFRATVKAEQNPNYEERTATLTIRSRELVHEITVTQEAGEPSVKYEALLGSWNVTGKTSHSKRDRAYAVTVEQKVYGESYTVRGWTKSGLGRDYPLEMRYDRHTGNVTIDVQQVLGTGYIYDGGPKNVTLTGVYYKGGRYDIELSDPKKHTFTGTLGGDGRVRWTCDDPSIVAFEYMINTSTEFYYASDNEDYLLEPVMERSTTPQYYKDRDVVQLYRHSKGRGVNLIILGDGYTAAYDLNKGGKFEQDARKAFDEYFAVEPYTTLKPYFDVYMIAAASLDRGATVQSRNQTRNTCFTSVIEGGGSTGIGCDYNKVFNFTAEAGVISTNEDLRNSAFLVLINEDIYAGTCAMFLDTEAHGYNIGMVPMCTTFPVGRIIRHESGGHGWGHLADEYRYYNTVIPADEKNERQGWKNYGYFSNCTFNTRANAPWAHYYTRTGYEMVGYYQGGLLYYQGVWRPEPISCMEDNRDYFNAPSRERIWRRTKECAGETFSLDEFLDYDKINIGAAGAAKRNLVERPMPSLGEPVMIDTPPSLNEIRRRCEMKKFRRAGR